MVVCMSNRIIENDFIEIAGTKYVIPGLHSGIENDLYHSADGVSKSMLDVLADKTPQHLKFARESGASEPTKAMIIGTAVHCAVLEPLEFEHKYLPMPNFSGKGSVNDKKEFLDDCALNNKIALKSDDYQKVVSMRDSALRHPVLKTFLKDGRAETSGFWHDKYTAELCRIRPDFLPDGMDVCIDLKTAQRASFSEFSKSVNKYRYHVSDAMYRDGLLQITGNSFAFLFAVIETEPPYLCALYELDYQARSLGHTMYRRLLDRYKEAKLNKFSEGYPIDIRTLDLPTWAKTQPII